MARSVNLDFFAAEADQRAVLDFLFSSTDVRVFESYSEYDADLREFRSTDELAAAFQLGIDPWGNGKVILLQVVVALGHARLDYQAVRARSGALRRAHVPAQHRGRGANATVSWRAV
jgi:hypothetical protein